MPTATLLLREPATCPLTAVVEKALARKSPLRDHRFDLVLTPTHLELAPKPPEPSETQEEPSLFLPARRENPASSSSSLAATINDEGFESDIDSLSLVSNEDDFVPIPKPSHPETDSANGSAGSDSDTETLTPQSPEEAGSERFNLVDCLCYTDIKVPSVLVFVIKNEALVFSFGDLGDLNRFYLSFSAFKAVANQRVYNYSGGGTKYNLLQRTDNNGVTHIQITREPEAKLYAVSDRKEESLSLKTPKDVNSRQRNQSLLITDSRCNTLQARANNARILDSKPKLAAFRSSSNENLLDENEAPLRKVWNSAEDLLDAPKRPERRKRTKGRAPPPPIPKPQATDNQSRNARPPNVLEAKPLLGNIINQAKSKLTTYQQFKLNSEAKKIESATLSRATKVPNETTWTNSVPRFLKKHRSRSETRNFTPMAYRYIDTTRNAYPQYPAVNGISNVTPASHHATISNRLFGMSSKLKEFGAVQCASLRRDSLDSIDSKWKSLRGKSGDSSLKSVIKKEDAHKKRSNEKKVTFSAYTTVQVV